jgi:hypothetical protein
MAMQYNGKRLQQQQEEDPGATTPSSAMLWVLWGAWMDGWMEGTFKNGDTYTQFLMLFFMCVGFD